MCHVVQTVEVHIEFWWADVRERNHLEDSGIHGRIGLKWIIRKWDGGHDFIYALFMLSNSKKLIKIDQNMSEL